MKRFAAAVVLVTLACLGYVYAEVETFKIGYTIRKQEEMRTQFLDRARALKYNIARLKSPANLEKRLAAQKVLLESPKTWQTLVVTNQPTVQPGWQTNSHLIWMQSVLTHPSIVPRFFVGTAEAQAKESSN